MNLAIYSLFRVPALCSEGAPFRMVRIAVKVMVNATAMTTTNSNYVQLVAILCTFYSTYLLEWRTFGMANPRNGGPNRC